MIAEFQLCETDLKELLSPLFLARFPQLADADSISLEVTGDREVWLSFGLNAVAEKAKVAAIDKVMPDHGPIMDVTAKKEETAANKKPSVVLEPETPKAEEKTEIRRTDLNWTAAKARALELAATGLGPIPIAEKMTAEGIPIKMAQVRAIIGNAKRSVQEKKIENKPVAEDMPPCTSCQSIDTIKYGRDTSGAQLYKCKSCDKKFNPEADQKPDPALVAEARQLRADGLTYRDICGVFAQRGIQMEHSTVYRWCQGQEGAEADPSEPSIDDLDAWIKYMHFDKSRTYHEIKNLLLEKGIGMNTPDIEYVIKGTYSGRKNVKDLTSLARDLKLGKSIDHQLPTKGDALRDDDLSPIGVRQDRDDLEDFGSQGMEDQGVEIGEDSQ